jgi:hypothetical protein
MTAGKITLVTWSALTWVACIAAAFAYLNRYSSIPGAAFDPKQSAGEFLASVRQPGRPVILVAVHPRCPCTDATLAELGDLLARSDGRCDAVMLEFQPLNPTSDWPKPATNQTLGGVPVRIITDTEGQLAEKIGAHTSGHLVLVDATGAIRFRGGLTLSRGHRGRSPAQDAILATIMGREPALNKAPVFGCALLPDCKGEPNE